jgi:hypothetical protein
MRDTYIEFQKRKVEDPEMALNWFKNEKREVKEKLIVQIKKRWIEDTT